jgi:hypothetical protein
MLNLKNLQIYTGRPSVKYCDGAYHSGLHAAIFFQSIISEHSHSQELRGLNLLKNVKVGFGAIKSPPYQYDRGFGFNVWNK